MLAEIATRTDGVPLFVEEVTKAVLESDRAPGKGNGLVPDGPMRRLAVPATLHDSMMARLDRLESVKEVAQTAACIGREFDFRLLEAVSRIPAQALRDRLARLEEAQIVFRSRAPHEEQFTFKHALVRDAAYESLLKATRQQIHARILAALEGAPDAPPEVLAWHAAEAGLVEKAIDCWQAAGKRAIARPAYEEAISHLAHLT